MSYSFFNNTLVVFVCLSLYLSFCFPKCLQFYKLSYVILNFNVHMLDENLQFYQKMSIPFLNYILIVFVSLSLYLWKLPQKFQILHFLWIFIIFSVICYAKFFRFIRKFPTFFFNYSIVYLYAYHFIWVFFSKKFSIL